MNWAETMKSNAGVAVPGHVFDDESSIRRPRTGSWDAFEVWLTRSKQPRDSVASSATAVKNGIADRRY